MKKLFFMLCVGWLLLPCRGDAQLLEDYGIKCALTSATLSIDYKAGLLVPSVQRRVGFNVALYAEWFSLPYLSLITQVEYDQRGCLEPLQVGVANPASQRIDYLSVPLFIKVRYPLGEAQPYLFAGPRFDFKLDYQKTDMGDWPTPPYSEFKPTLLGTSLGAGLELPKFAPLPLLVEFRYNLDFSNSYSSFFYNMKNNAFDFWIGVEL